MKTPSEGMTERDLGTLSAKTGEISNTLSAAGRREK
jgi:hypothetical protein